MRKYKRIKGGTKKTKKYYNIDSKEHAKFNMFIKVFLYILLASIFIYIAYIFIKKGNNDTIKKDKIENNISQKLKETQIKYKHSSISLDTKNISRIFSFAKKFYHNSDYYKSQKYCRQIINITKEKEINDIITIYQLSVLNYIKMFDLESAKEMLKQCENIDNNNIKNKELSSMIEEEEKKNEENIKKFKKYSLYLNFMKNLYKMGLYLNKLEISFISENYRFCKATENISNKELLFRLPLEGLITLDDARKSILGSYFTPLIKKKLNSPKLSLLSVFILNEIDKGNQSKWKFYFDFLPSNYSNFPSFYEEKECECLKGTQFLESVKNKKKYLKQDYDLLIKEIPELYKYDFNSFKKAREIIGSRVFGVIINKTRNTIVVPFADLLNHKRPAQTYWNFNQERNSFFIRSVKNFQKGEEVFDSYGPKPNKQLLLNYGFTIINNIDNYVEINLLLNKNYPYIKEKMALKNIKNNNKHFWLGLDIFNIKTKDFFSFMRFILYKESNYSNINSKNPISIENEKDLFENLKEIMLSYINKYPTTLDDDNDYFEKNKNNMEINEYNCYVIRIGEKKIFHFYLNMSIDILQLLNTNKDELKNLYNYIFFPDGKNCNISDKIFADKLLKYKYYLSSVFRLLKY